MVKQKIFTWRRYDGYEVSSKGDNRFSALFARFPNEYLNGKTIEEIYQLQIKGYQIYGDNWRLGKGKPPLDPSVDLWREYSTLWRLWSHLNIALMRELYVNASYDCKYILTDMFATTHVNQAHALAECLNELITFNGPNPNVVDILNTNTYKQQQYQKSQLKEY